MRRPVAPRIPRAGQRLHLLLEHLLDRLQAQRNQGLDKRDAGVEFVAASPCPPGQRLALASSLLHVVCWCCRTATDCGFRRSRTPNPSDGDRRSPVLRTRRAKREEHVLEERAALVRPSSSSGATSSRWERSRWGGAKAKFETQLIRDGVR